MKIRTDFVTNSSSSSFVLVVRIGLKNGKVLKFIGDSGIGEGNETYCRLSANENPCELGRSKDVHELIEKLKASIVEEPFSDEEPEQVLDDSDSIIMELKDLSSMNEIEKITINGDLYGNDDQHQYKHFTYYRDSGVLFYDEGGEEVYDEGTGGEIGFGEKTAVPGNRFGEAISRKKGYTRRFCVRPAYDQDVDPDPEKLSQEKRRVETLRAQYAALRERFLGLIQGLTYEKEIDFFRTAFLTSIDILRQTRSVFSNMWAYCTNEAAKADYMVVDDEVPAAEFLAGDQLEQKAQELQQYMQVIDSECSDRSDGSTMKFVKIKDFYRAIQEENEAGFPSFTKGLEEWKRTIPFDHVSEIDCAGKTFAIVGLSGNKMTNYLGIDYSSIYEQPIKGWLRQNGGVCQYQVSLKCNYVIAGLEADKTDALAKAIRYRDSGKSSLKIIPEDECLRLLNGETL